MYEHVTQFIDSIEEMGFEQAGKLAGGLTHALYLPEIVDVGYRGTLDNYGLEGARPWVANIEALDLPAVVALLTWVHRADHFCEGAMASNLKNGFVYRILLRLRELESGTASPSVLGFWRADEQLGCCSNWYQASFDFGGVRFPTCEHWMMWQKAVVMDDESMAARILDASSPKEAKDFGASVSPYDNWLWDKVREQLVYYGVREKFLQNGLARNLLLSTGSAILAEASPYDGIWGIGMSANDPDFNTPSKWKGSNLLGRVCMRVRSDLRNGLLEARPGPDGFARAALDSGIGRMTLLQLTRHPAARTAVITYARIARHLRGTNETIDHLLEREGIPLAKVDGLVRNGRSTLVLTGWDELLNELGIQLALGKL